MLKHMLSGTALAVLLAATPVVAQQSTTVEEAPAAEATTEQGAETLDNQAAGAADATGSSETTTTTTTVESESATDSMDTAEGEALEGDVMDSAESDALEGDALDTAAGDDMLETDELDTADSDLDRPASGDMAASTGETYIGEQMEDELLASEFMGATIENAEGENLGSINDVIISETTGAKAVIVGVGGFLGIGQKDVAVNYDIIEQVRDENGDVRLVLNTTRDDLENAPEFVSLQERIDEQRQASQQMQQDQAPMGGSPAMNAPASPPAGGATTAQ